MCGAQSHLILEKCDHSLQQERKKQQKHGAPRIQPKPSEGKIADESELQGLDFSEFLSATEGGQIIKFDTFLKEASRRAKIDPSVDKAACEAAFDAARAAKLAKFNRLSTQPEDGAPGDLTGSKPILPPISNSPEP